MARPDYESDNTSTNRTRGSLVICITMPYGVGVKKPSNNHGQVPVERSEISSGTNGIGRDGLATLIFVFAKVNKGKLLYSNRSYTKAGGW
jgi:hypothetical protein